MCRHSRFRRMCRAFALDTPVNDHCTLNSITTGTWVDGQQEQLCTLVYLTSWNDHVCAGYVCPHFEWVGIMPCAQGMPLSFCLRNEAGGHSRTTLVVSINL